MGYGLNPVWWAFCSSFHGFWPCRPGHAAAGISWFVVDSVTFQHSRRSHQTPFHAFIDSLRHRPLPTLGGKVWKDYDGFGGRKKLRGSRCSHHAGPRTQKTPHDELRPGGAPVLPARQHRARLTTPRVGRGFQITARTQRSLQKSEPVYRKITN